MASKFDALAEQWDEDSRKVRLAQAVAGAISRNLDLRSGQTLLDYGAGTGLVSFELLPHVGRVFSLDTSEEMLAVLSRKALASGAEKLTAVRFGFGDADPGLPKADVLVMSMVLHHVEDIGLAARTCFELLGPGGQLALADLDQEDGSFHSEGMQYFHRGFSRETLGDVFFRAGFTALAFHDVITFSKPGADGKAHDYSVFLMTGRRP